MWGTGLMYLYTSKPSKVDQLLKGGVNMVSFENRGICMERHAASAQFSNKRDERGHGFLGIIISKETRADGFWFIVGVGRLEKWQRKHEKRRSA